MKIKAINFQPGAVAPRHSRWFSTYHKCINSSRCNKLFGLIFLMSIGAIFISVIVTAVIRAVPSENSTPSNTTRELADGENSMHGAVGGLLESFNDTLGDFGNVMTSTEATSTDNRRKDANDDEEDTTTTTIETTTISFVLPTESEGTTIVNPPHVIPKCTVNSQGFCLVTCFNVEASNLLWELKRAVDEDVPNNSCAMHNLQLLLDTINFSVNEELPSNWLSEVGSTSFRNLTITRSNFDGITGNTFVNGPFSAANTIVISEMVDLSIYENSFIGLSNLNTLTFSNINTLTPRNGFNFLSLSSMLTKLEVIGVRDPWSVQRLTGGINQFEKLAEIKFSRNNFSLTNLNSSFTGVTASVKDLDLSDSSIMQLSSNAFTNCTILEVIQLYNNLLTTLPWNIFDGLPGLRYLYLQNNQLTTLPDGFLMNFFYPPYQLHLLIANNSWDCSLDILNLRKLFVNPNIRFLNGGANSTCSNPDGLRNTRIADLWCTVNICKITCNRTSGELEKVLELFNMTHCDWIELEVFDHDFNDKTIPSFWLSNLNYSIDILKLISTIVQFINVNAFNSTTFNNLNTLVIDGNGDPIDVPFVIEKNSFNGLNNLQKLELIRLTHVQNIRFEVFQKIGPTVKDMTIAHISSTIFLRILFGNNTFHQLERLNLTGNNFGSSTTNFSRSTFSGVHGCLKKLYLNNSRIQHINPGAFDDFEKLVELHLQDNELPTLPNRLFDVIKETQPDFEVNLENNLWNCTTDLCHLLPFVNENVLCVSPIELANETMLKLNESCDFGTTLNADTTSDEGEETNSTVTVPIDVTTTTEDPTTPEITTTSPIETTTSIDPTTTTETTPTIPDTTTTTLPETTTTTLPETTTTTTDLPTTVTTTTTSQSTSTTATEEPSTVPETTTSTLEPSTPQTTSTISTTNNPGDGNLSIPCLNGTFILANLLFNTISLTLPSRDSITVYRPPVMFTVESKGPNEVALHFDGSQEGMALLYYPVHYNPFDTIPDDNSEVHCRVVDEPIIVISNLLANTVYTFCSLFKDPMFTPFQCMSYANTEGMPWLYEEQRVVIVTSLTLVLLLALVTGILMTYFLIRRMPTLIRGSKRVVIVNNRSKEVMILPRSNNDSRNNSYRKESVVTPIVPEPPTYLTPLPRQSFEHRPPFVRSNSDTSLKSYVSVSRLPPRFSQVFQRGDFDNDPVPRHRNGSYARQYPSAPYQQSPELPPPLPRRSVVSTASSAHHSNASTCDVGKLSRSNNQFNSTLRHHSNRREVEEENHYNVII